MKALLLVVLGLMACVSLATELESSTQYEQRGPFLFQDDVNEELLLQALITAKMVHPASRIGDFKTGNFMRGLWWNIDPRGLVFAPSMKKRSFQFRKGDWGSLWRSEFSLCQDWAKESPKTVFGRGTSMTCRANFGDLQFLNGHDLRGSRPIDTLDKVEQWAHFFFDVGTARIGCQQKMGRLGAAYFHGKPGHWFSAKQMDWTVNRLFNIPRKFRAAHRCGEFALGALAHMIFNFYSHGRTLRVHLDGDVIQVTDARFINPLMLAKWDRFQRGKAWKTINDRIDNLPGARAAVTQVTSLMSSAIKREPYEAVVRPIIQNMLKFTKAARPAGNPSFLGRPPRVDSMRQVRILAKESSGANSQAERFEVFRHAANAIKKARVTLLLFRYNVKVQESAVRAARYHEANVLRKWKGLKKVEDKVLREYTLMKKHDTSLANQITESRREELNLRQVAKANSIVEGSELGKTMKRLVSQRNELIQRRKAHQARLTKAKLAYDKIKLRRAHIIKSFKGLQRVSQKRWHQYLDAKRALKKELSVIGKLHLFGPESFEEHITRPQEDFQVQNMDDGPTSLTTDEVTREEYEWRLQKAQEGKNIAPEPKHPEDVYEEATRPQEDLQVLKLDDSPNEMHDDQEVREEYTWRQYAARVAARKARGDTRTDIPED